MVDEIDNEADYSQCLDTAEVYLLTYRQLGIEGIVALVLQVKPWRENLKRDAKLFDKVGLADVAKLLRGLARQAKPGPIRWSTPAFKKHQRRLLAKTPTQRDVERLREDGQRYLASWLNAVLVHRRNCATPSSH